jgi:glycosyltransferase involved in cell wall biosynthesis
LKTSVGARWSVAPAAALRQRGHDVTFCLPDLRGPLVESIWEAGMDAVQADAPAFGGGFLQQPAAVVRLRQQLLSGLRADVVVSHLYASAMLGRAALARSDVPHVHASHGPLFLENAAIHAAERVLWRLDAHHIGSSEVMARRYLSLGMPAERVSAIPNGIPHDWADVDRAALRNSTRTSLGIDAATFVVVCLAYFYAPKRLVHRGRGIKGHDVLLPAWDVYRRRGGRGELLLVGGGFGPGGDQYRTEVMSRFSGVPGVHWIGDTDDVRPYLAAADVNVAPSLSENIGSPAEAGFMGVPSLASDVGGLPELVEDGVTGWLVEPDQVDALADRLAAVEQTDRDVRAKLASAAESRARTMLDERANSARWADVVERVAGAGRP